MRDRGPLNSRQIWCTLFILSHSSLKAESYIFRVYAYETMDYFTHFRSSSARRTRSANRSLKIKQQRKLFLASLSIVCHTE